MRSVGRSLISPSYTIDEEDGDVDEGEVGTVLTDETHLEGSLMGLEGREVRARVGVDGGEKYGGEISACNPSRS